MGAKGDQRIEKTQNSNLKFHDFGLGFFVSKSSGSLCIEKVLNINNIMEIKTKKDLEIANKGFMEIKSRLLRKKSNAESHFASMLNKSGLYFIREKCNFKKNTKWCYYDFYIPRLKLYVEIDGVEHNLPKNKAIDDLKESFVKKKSCFLIRFSNEYILSIDNIDRDFLLNSLFLKISKEKYMRMLAFNRKQQMFDIKNEYGKDVIKKKVHLYSHTTGQYYEFKNIHKCCAHTGFKASYILELLNIEYCKASSRLYVAAETLSICEQRVSVVYE